MTKNKQIDEQSAAAETPVEDELNGQVDEAEVVEQKSGKGKKPAKSAAGYQGIRSGFRDQHRGAKIGNAPRGTRRTMGKR